MKKNEFKKISAWLWIGIFICAIGLPVFVNYMMIWETPFGEVAGEPDTWLQFFGGYIGAFLSVGISLYILNRTLRQNAEYNKEQKKLQVDMLELSREKEKIAELNKIVIDNINILDYKRFMVIGSKINANSLYEAMILTNDFENDVNNAVTKVEIFYNDKFDTNAKKEYLAALKVVSEGILGIIQGLKTVLNIAQEGVVESLGKWERETGLSDPQEQKINSIMNNGLGIIQKTRDLLRTMLSKHEENAKRQLQLLKDKSKLLINSEELLLKERTINIKQ